MPNQTHDTQNSNKKPEVDQNRKNRVFVPITLKMVEDAQPRPDDVCEIDGEAVNDV